MDGWDYGMFQETRQHVAGAARAEARRLGWRVQAGRGRPGDRDLVWGVARHGAVTEIELNLGPRLVAAVWSPGGPTAIRLYTLYGEARADKDTQAATSE